MNTRSIHVRLILWYTALIILLSAGFGAFTYKSLHDRLYAELADSLKHRVEHLRDDVLNNLQFNAPTTLAKEIEDVYSPAENDRFIRISKPDGTILYVSGKPSDGSFDPAHVPVPHNYTSSISEQMISLRSSDHLLLVGFVAAQKGQNYIIEMGASTGSIESALQKLLLTLLIGLPPVVVIAVIGGSMLVRRALLPVENIRATAEQITFSNPKERLPVANTGDALEHLSRTLNQMLERLEFAYQQASRFSADASHELRTPLAIMRSELESMNTTVWAWNVPSEFRDRIANVLEETERLSSIVEGLFAIVRLDAGEAVVTHDMIELGNFARATIEQMTLMAEEKLLSVTIDAPHPVYVAGDAARLKQVIVNLLDNAIKYSLPGGVVKFFIASQAGKAVLSIEDNGIGIPQEAQPYVFERFYRADKLRADREQGAGLGLSIVRSICLAHGGAVRLQSVEGAGTTVTVELPLTEIRGEQTHAAA